LASDLFDSDDDYCKAITVQVASNNAMTNALSGYYAENVFMRTESGVQKLVKIPKNETEVTSNGVTTNDGWTYFIKSCTVANVCETLEAVMQTKCTPLSNKIFLVN
jgi:hypothetical protein